MRVVHTHRIAGIGGSERHLLTLLPALAAREADVSFVGLDVRGRGADAFYAELERVGVPFERIPSEHDVDPLAVARLRQAVRRRRPDLLHTHLVHADTFGALAGAGVPIVSTKHNDDPFRAGPFRFAERAITRRARRVICITEALRRFNRDVVGLPADKLVVVHYGMDEPPPAWGSAGDLKLEQDARVLLAVARLVPQKGLDVALRAFAELRPAEPRAVLVVLGEGPERNALEALALSLGVAAEVHFPGHVGDVTAWLRRSELLLHPARWEGFGLVLLEAMLAAKPVVATRVSAIPEIVVDGETGRLVEPDDAPALAAALGDLLADPDRARCLGEAGLNRAHAEFSVARMADATLRVYADALG